MNRPDDDEAPIDPSEMPTKPGKRPALGVYPGEGPHRGLYVVRRGPTGSILMVGTEAQAREFIEVMR